MNKFLIAALAAAAFLPSAAMAKPADYGREHRSDTRVVVVDRHAKPLPAAWQRPVTVKRIVVGAQMDRDFVRKYTVIQHPARYRLARVNANSRWLKVRDDAVLVNLRNGRVIDVRYNIFR